jgi:AraC family transcriptional regulator
MGSNGLMTHPRADAGGPDEPIWSMDSARTSPFGTLTVCEAEMPAGLRTRHEHAELHLCFVLQGGFEQEDGARSTTMRDASTRVSPAGAAADLRFGPAGAQCFLLHLADLDPSDARWLTPARPIFLDDSGTAGLARQAREAYRADGEAPLVLDALALELFAHAARRPAARGRQAPRWLVRARDEIRDRFAEPLVLADLAAEAGVTPVHLARAFRGRYGCSMGAYLRAVRVAHVQRALERPAAALAAIALDAGFYDQAHMTRVFARALGTTPAAYRRMVK